jgi:hypothetical protein
MIISSLWHKSSFNKVLSGLSFACVIGCTAGAQANGIANEQIVGVFSNPVLFGNVANDPSLGQTTFFDNTGRATVTANGGTLTWGSLAGGGSGSFSVLNFFGSTVPASGNIDTVPFQIGTITFSNGTSDLTSLIFGAKLSFYVTSASPQNLIGTDNVVITTTSNLGNSISQDADYINICGPGSNICGLSISAFENSASTANLFGTIVGDPVLTITGAQVTGDGQLGTEPPIAAVPLHSSWQLNLIGLAGIGFMAYRRKSKPALMAA